MVKIQILTHINPKKSKVEFLDKIWNFWNSVLQKGREKLEKDLESPYLELENAAEVN